MQSGKLDKIRRDRNASEELRQAAYNLNMRFSEHDFKHEGIRTGSSASNPALGRYLIRYLKSSNSDTRKIGIAVRNWYFKNNTVRDEVKHEISTVRKTLK